MALVFLPLDRLTVDDRPRVGGKAWNCGRLKQAGFSVPDGIAVPVDATDDDVATLSNDAWFRPLPADERFAVRSSGIAEDSGGHSFAGVHDTMLNVERAGLIAAVLECRRSPQSEQARAYRAARKIDDTEARIGVLVQRMVPAVTSGVAFTVNPVSGADEIVVNAVSGLGDDLVSGRVVADECRLSKTGAASRSPLPATLRGLDVGALRDLLVAIERHYAAPQDVEWCHDGRQFWILQSRPITAVRAAPSRSDASRAVEWTRANLIEVLPEQMSRQTRIAYEVMLNRAQRKYMGRLLAPDDELGPVFKAFHGRMYMNLSQMRRVTSIVRAPAADMLRSLGHPEVIRPEDAVVQPAPLREALRCLPDLIRLGSLDTRMEKVLHEHEARTRDTIARITRADPHALSDREIWDMVEQWVTEAPDAIQIVFLMSGVLFRESFLHRVCQQAGFPYDRLVYPQLAAGQRSVSSQQAFDLVALADVARGDETVTRYLRAHQGSFPDFRTALAGTAFLQRFERFLDEYGHRGRYESDWALPRLHENPAPALFAIRERLDAAPQDAHAIAARQDADAAAAWRAFTARLTWWQRIVVLPRVRSTLRRLKQQYVWREQVRSDLTRVLRYGRAYHLTLAGRFVERGWLESRDDYFLLSLDEIAPAIRDPGFGPALRDLAARHRAEHEAERDLVMPLFMRESDLASLIGRRYETAPPDGSVLTGLCVSPGAIEAEVVVMRDPGEFATMKRGAILVTTATDPSWTPLFTLASGVIVELGGMLSHASTIAREYGLPALANVQDATRRLRTGERVRLDASGGRVERLSVAEPAAR